jgi:hypothetical protein
MVIDQQFAVSPSDDIAGIKYRRFEIATVSKFQHTPLPPARNRACLSDVSSRALQMSLFFRAFPYSMLFPLPSIDCGACEFRGTGAKVPTVPQLPMGLALRYLCPTKT